VSSSARKHELSGTVAPASLPRLSGRLAATVTGVFCSLAALLIATLLLARYTGMVQDTTAEQARLSDWQRQLQEIFASLTDAETGQRGYLLTGKQRYLAPYSAATAQLPRSLRSLDIMATQEPRFARLVHDIHSEATAKLAELAETVRLHDAGAAAAALALVQTDAGQGSMEKLRANLRDLGALIDADRRRIDSALLERSVFTRRLAAITAAALVICVLLATLQIASLLAARSRYASALAASEQRHRAIIEEQTELVSLSHPDGALLFANAAYQSFFGMPQAELGRQPFDAPVLENDRTELRRCMGEVVRGGVPCKSEVRVLNAAGETRWIAWRHRLQQHEEAEPVIQSVGRDVTERRALEQRLEANERFIRAITDAIPLRLAYFDATERLQFANRRLCERLGKPLEELIGLTLDDATGATPPDLVAQRLKFAVKGRLERFEHSDLVKGDPRRFETYLIPDLGPSGEVRGVFGVGMDITRLKYIEASLRRLTEVFDNTPDYVAQADWQGRVRYLNPAARRAVGLGDSDAVEGRMFSEFYSVETNARWGGEIIPAVKETGVWIGETSVLLAGGRTVPVNHMVIAHRDAQGRVARYSSIMRDISSEVAARAALARQTATLNAVIESVPATVAIWDADRRCRLVNRAFERWRQTRRESLIGLTLDNIFGKFEYQPDRTYIERVLAGETVAYEKDYPGSAGKRWLSVSYTPLRLKDGRVGGFVAMTQDITHHREENLRLAHLAERDPLTGLLNRIGFENHLERVGAQGQDASLALLYIDLDHFKSVNDRFGHATGDEVLREFANRLRNAFRPSDAVARLGGDEFAVAICALRDSEHAGALAAKVVALAAQPIAAAERTFAFGASVGVAFNAAREGGWRALVQRADAMAYRAKAQGRGRYAVEGEPDRDFRESIGGLS
jgi:diguanylate cyclase (GGDEF)-like protein/PAS domain S-box-containing protein